MDSGKTATSSGVVQINIAQSDIVADAAGFALVRLSEIELVTFCVRVGQRSITFFVDPSLDERETFYFRNCFNVWDWAALPQVTTAKTDVDRSLAVINGTSRFYNQTTEKTYEVQAQPLTSDEAAWIDQLFSSHDVFRIEPDPTNSYDPLVLARYSLLTPPAKSRTATKNLTRSSLHGDIQTTARLYACLPRPVFSHRPTT